MPGAAVSASTSLYAANVRFQALECVPSCQGVNPSQFVCVCVHGRLQPCAVPRTDTCTLGAALAALSHNGPCSALTRGRPPCSCLNPPRRTATSQPGEDMQRARRAAPPAPLLAALAALIPLVVGVAGIAAASASAVPPAWCGVGGLAQELVALPGRGLSLRVACQKTRNAGRPTSSPPRPVLLLHGFPELALGWAPVVSAMAALGERDAEGGGYLFLAPDQVRKATWSECMMLAYPVAYIRAVALFGLVCLTVQSIGISIDVPSAQGRKHEVCGAAIKASRPGAQRPKAGSLFCI